jgi:glycerate kinase
MTTVLIAPDSFKGSLTAFEAAEAMARGVRRVFPDVQTVLHPISDGGEGLVRVLHRVIGGELRRTPVSGPLPDQRVDAEWLWIPQKSLAVLEMAEAAGLSLVPPESRNPSLTTTYGVGELLVAALDAGAASVTIGIGGSATNDGGAGMAEALGVRFLDKEGRQLERGGLALERLAKIDLSRIDLRLRSADIVVASDVQNPLCGENGASLVYGPQKGASRSEAERLDRALLKYATTIRQQLGVDILHLPGSGAAGGLGAGLVAFCGARIKAGIDVVLDSTGFDEVLLTADLVLTGEGRLDEQVRYGKAIGGLIARCRRRRKPVLAVVGSLQGSRASFVNDRFLDDIESIVNGSVREEEAMQRASALVEERTESLLRRYLAAHAA